MIVANHHKIILYSFCFFIILGCSGQKPRDNSDEFYTTKNCSNDKLNMKDYQIFRDSIVYNLRQVSFSDTTLTKTISGLIRSSKCDYCFDQNELYIINFFQSSLASQDQFFLTIDRFNCAELCQDICYYTVIDNITFLIPTKAPVDIIKEIGNTAPIVISRTCDFEVGGDYLFLIWKMGKDHYAVLLNQCDE